MVIENSSKMKVEIIYFAKDVLTQTEKERAIHGEMYIEKRPTGKFLCFAKGGVTTILSLTKKMYKSLNRFFSGIKMERYYDINSDEADEILYSELDESTVLTEEDVFYTEDRYLYIPKNKCNLPTVVPPKPKKKAEFIVQIFQYKEKK